VPVEAVTCGSVASLLPAMADGSEVSTVSLAATRHVASCLACQAELARYRRLSRSLTSLRGFEVRPPDGSLEAVLDALDGHLDRWRGRKLAYGAVAAGAAAAAVLFARSRRGRLPLAG